MSSIYELRAAEGKMKDILVARKRANAEEPNNPRAELARVTSTQKWFGN